MKKITLLILFILAFNVLAAEDTLLTAKSPATRVAVLELYTSEGCSSCPPAEDFLSALKDAGISDQQLIPMAFHVTYWDYIGWKDRFAKKQYDQRQRDLAKINSQKTIYTPQFVLVGDDYRRYDTFSEDINKLAAQKAVVDLKLTAQLQNEQTNADQIVLELITTAAKDNVKNVIFYFAVIENKLFSDVREGENAGKKLRHDYVVRHLSRPYVQDEAADSTTAEHTVTLNAEWKRQHLSIVAFAQNSQTGEVLQAVRLKL